MKKHHYILWYSSILALLLSAEEGLPQNSVPQEGFRKYLNRQTTESRKLKDSKQHDWYYTGLEVNYIALNALDLITTFHSLGRGAKEANPVAKLFIKKRPLAIVLKGGITGVVLFGLTRVKKRDKRIAYVTLGLLNVAYGLVVANNIGVYLRLNR